ncbi:cobaltochelatase subunit CobN [candidate division KSB1 bacterium]|nr:cobaltochelatase subunit CobN [candidate division KSB1 bacterium]
MYKIVFLLDGHTPVNSIETAISTINSKDKIDVKIIRQTHIDSSDEKFEEALSVMDASDFIVIAAHGSITIFKKFNQVMDRYAESKKLFFYVGIQDEVNAVLPRLTISAQEYAQIFKYFIANTPENYSNMFSYLAYTYGGIECTFKPATLPQWDGLFEINETERIKIIETAKNTNKTILGVIINHHLIQNDDLQHIRKLLYSIEKQNSVAIPIFTASVKNEAIGQRGVEAVMKDYFMLDGEVCVDAIINTSGYSMTIFNAESVDENTLDTSVFQQFSVPVIQAYSTYFSYEKWRESIIGLDAIALVSGIYYPEFDGQIGSYPIASHRYVHEAGMFRAEPINERIDKVVRLTINWAHLHRMKNEDKKVAIIFHNSPPRNDMIGCAAGLDSPASVLNIINKLSSAGVTTDYEFENGDEIIYKIIDGVSNDITWLSPDEMLSRSIDRISKQKYLTWYKKLPEIVRQRIEKDWGQAPGEMLVHEDQFPVPGILNGNIFIGLQPLRGFEDKAEECYHSCDIVCPHQYVAFYKWVKNVFEADVIFHIGTHGTIEWLPGKEKGLSDECFPDFCIDDMPHLYLYHISVVGEGIQAKRRSSAVLLEHMIPSMLESGTYDRLTDLDDMIKEYFKASHVAKYQLNTLQDEIWKLTVELNMHEDLLLSADEKPADFDSFITKLHSWTETVKQSTIKDGLHIFGEVPEEERLQNMLRLLVRIKNGSVLSLTQGVAHALGYDYNQLTRRPDEFVKPALTGHLALDECTELAKAMVNDLHTVDYDTSHIQSTIQKHIPNSGNSKDLNEVLTFICTKVLGNVNKTTDELMWCDEGNCGRMVAPGQGGCPTRGNVHILPTGRNFYALDPAAVPSRAAYTVGKRMAEELLERYIKDENRLPESIGIVLYAGDQMKTGGDDIAEVLYLMGVRPVWIGSSNRVSGLELVSLEELGRPRIDVTCRISGLLRDTFPNLIEMIDTAVNMVASADEPLDQNYIKKHVSEEVEELVAKGMDPDVAQQESMLRVFSCPPGTYGGGVDILIESKKWETQEDLGYVSVTWSCHAYSAGLHGKTCRETYERRLSKTDATVKNENSVEFDIYEIDDEYIYHGGMIAAVTKLSGKKPRSYYGNSANPEITKIADVREETARIVRARMLNPLWIDGLKKHGYKGAQDISFNMDNLFGWDATADTIEDWMYEKLAEHLLFNQENRDWMQEVNQWALHHITERMLEAIQRQMWNASDDMKERLSELYLELEGNLEEKTFSEAIT